jgi:hypothetical protein
LKGYTGQFCDNQVNYCTSQPCSNNGVCVSTTTGFFCYCSSVYTGLTCSTPINPCLSQPCFANNTLNCTNNNLTYTCYCQPGFTGSISFLLKNKNIFFPLIKGATCTQPTSGCSSVQTPCQNGGICVNTIGGGYSCQCNGFYQGNDCSIPADPCSSNPCTASSSISCQITINRTTLGYSCTCRAGITGKDQKE